MECAKCNKKLDVDKTQKSKKYNCRLLFHMLKIWKSQLGQYGYTPNFYTSDIGVIKVSRSSQRS